ncbi:hypothetical protein FVE85_8950 [Porphyridium purpureum]|uniref:Uncharacterized protein n=1 Tax=Porphyridium purpureum TaxID=35688 RepID=A0A5J4YFH5_PORPP|nr:hypothetical protein FVE85_8950 [Porphyridium purpureum]|eukprot:POR8627..scf282_42
MPSATQLAGTHGSAPLSGACMARVAVRHMLGLSVSHAARRYVSGAYRARMPSAGPRWTSGHHALSAIWPSRYGRHALVVDAVAAFARAAGLPVERRCLPARLTCAGRPAWTARGSMWRWWCRPHRHRRSDGAALAAAARRKQASFQAAARTGDAAGVSFQAVILDTYGRREQCGAAFLETLVAAYMRHRGVSKMLASTALHRSLSLAVYRSVAAAVLLRHPGPTLPVASQHWLETGRRLFVGEVLSESEAESH